MLREFYHAWFRFHPEEAVTVGKRSFAGLLRPYDDDEIGALTSLLHKMHSALDELDQDDDLNFFNTRNVVIKLNDTTFF